MTNSPGEQPQDPWGRQDRPMQYPPSYGGQPPGYGPPGYGPSQDHPSATTALVLGILGVVLCGLIAPFAWRIGKRAVDEIDASHGQLGGRGPAQAGYVLGLIGTVLLAIGLLVVVLFGLLVVGGLATGFSSS